MKKSNLFILFFSFFFLLIFTVILINKNQYVDNKEKIVLYEDFNEKYEAFNKINFSFKDKEFHIIKKNDIWTIPDYDNYPVHKNKINDFFIHLSKLKLLDKKTNDPEFHSRLGVGFEKVIGQDSKRVKITNLQEEVIYHFIIGNKSQNIPNNNARYIRKADENQVWLFEQTLNIYKKPINWAKTSLFKLGRWRIQNFDSIDVKNKANNFTISRDTYDSQMYRLKDIPKGYTLSNSYATNSIVSTLEGMEIINIIKHQTISELMPFKEINVNTFDGLKMNIQVFLKNKNYFIKAQLSSDRKVRKELDKNGPKVIGIPNMKKFKEVEKEAKEYDFLNEWIFQLDDNTIKNLITNKADLLSKKD